MRKRPAFIKGDRAVYQRTAKELQVHCAIVDLLTAKATTALIWFHPANGEERPKGVGAKLKRMGVKAGVPDFSLTLPDGRSAYLEIKSGTGEQSPHQDAFQARCEAIGAPYAIARSVDEAEHILWSWGALRGPAPMGVAA